MVLNQLSEFKNPSEYNSVLVSKQNNLISNGLSVGHYITRVFFSLSLMICVLILLVAGQYEYTPSTAVRRRRK